MSAKPISTINQALQHTFLGKYASAPHFIYEIQLTDIDKLIK